MDEYIDLKDRQTVEFFPLSPLLAESLSWQLDESDQMQHGLVGDTTEVLQFSDLLDDDRDDVLYHGDESYDVLVGLMAAELTCYSFRLQQTPHEYNGVVRVG